MVWTKLYIWAVTRRQKKCPPPERAGVESALPVPLPHRAPGRGRRPRVFLDGEGEGTTACAGGCPPARAGSPLCGPRYANTYRPRVAKRVDRETRRGQKLARENVESLRTPVAPSVTGNDHRSRLRRHLETWGFVIQEVPRDNNCQFHAIADQLQQNGISGWDATKLRQTIVGWLRRNGDRPMDDGTVGEKTLLKDAAGVGSWESYLAEMSQHGRTWGDEATLLAASVLFEAEIYVISSLSADHYHIVTPPEVWNIKLTRRIYLGHYHEFHYVSTRFASSTR